MKSQCVEKAGVLKNCTKLATQLKSKLNDINVDATLQHILFNCTASEMHSVLYNVNVKLNVQK